MSLLALSILDAAKNKNFSIMKPTNVSLVLHLGQPQVKC